MASEDNKKKKEDTKADNDKFKFTLDQAIPDNLKYPSIGSVKNDAENLVRNSGVGLVNSKGNHESISLKKGYVTVAGGKLAALKIDGNVGLVQDTAKLRGSRTNRMQNEFDDLLFNGHKFNPVFYEYADYKKYTDQYGDSHVVGSLCVSGSVLVRAWDRYLQRNVLIRRPARFPMFAPLNNVPEIDKGLKIDDYSVYNEKYKAIQESSVSCRDFFKAVSQEYQKGKNNSTENKDGEKNDGKQEQEKQEEKDKSKDEGSNNK